MDHLTVLEIGRNAMITTILLSAPALGLSLAAGLVISVFQAATQIQEMTLSFVPKVLATILAVIIFGPWMMQVMLRFTTETWSLLAQLGR
jgi:flagellar biosynthetic protein FliQ